MQNLRIQGKTFLMDYILKPKNPGERNSYTKEIDKMSRYRPSMPPVAPYTGPLEPDEPDEPMPVKLKVDAFLEV